MNKDGVLVQLAEYLGAFRCHANLFGEIAGIVAKSGYERNFFALLVVQLHILTAQGKNSIRFAGFECLKHSDGELYSMHLDGRDFNLRILYSFLPDHTPVLLTAFFERGGKRTSDYTPYIPVAKERLNHERSLFNNEPFRV
jgi:hypothetical protein